ncbi:MAG: molybdopterin molybdotransferase MoeA [Hyphomicrobiaceae bacterium]|nr:molybdopterin molybdotransferase MoeA [Hyphomicrobiaceae bacterium]
MARSALTVEEALARILAGVVPGPAETVDLLSAAGRTLAEPVVAMRTQPPFDASAMDGYAVRAADVSALPAALTLIGEAAAGRAFTGRLSPHTAVRIFTGAPLPAGADAIVIQENTRRTDTAVEVVEGAPDAGHVRRAGSDFRAGDCLIEAGTRLAARHVLLAANAGHAHLQVHRRPRVAILATGDELVTPGDIPRDDQIVASNGYGLAALVAAAGGTPQYLGIARDTLDALAGSIAEAHDADVLVTIGGASVGDHDLVGRALTDAGFTIDFWKIAMRPGKPLLCARRGRLTAIGLPGNPVSSLICGRVFLVPLLARLSGRSGADGAPRPMMLAAPLPANGPRRHYLRARTVAMSDGSAGVNPLSSQDSSLSALLASADCLIVQPENDPGAAAGQTVPVLPIDF